MPRERNLNRKLPLHQHHHHQSNQRDMNDNMMAPGMERVANMVWVDDQTTFTCETRRGAITATDNVGVQNFNEREGDGGGGGKTLNEYCRTKRFCGCSGRCARPTCPERNCSSMTGQSRVSDKNEVCGMANSCQLEDNGDNTVATHTRLIGNREEDEDDGDTQACTRRIHSRNISHHYHSRSSGNCSRKPRRMSSPDRTQPTNPPLPESLSQSNQYFTKTNHSWPVIPPVSPSSTFKSSSSIISSSWTSFLKAQKPSSSSSCWSTASSTATVMVKVLFWVLVFNYHLSVLEACPNVCTCKWKGGKQTVSLRHKLELHLFDSLF